MHTKALIGAPTTVRPRGHVWTWDLIAQATVRGGALTILDNPTRECHVHEPIGP
jgi:hypothetical protein